METKTKVILTVVAAAVVGFMFEANSPLGKAVWGEAPAGPEPAGGQLAFLIVYGVIEAIGFGIGVAFLVFGWQYVRAAPVSKNTALIAYAAIGWGLVSWIPHSSMHITNAHDDFWRLIGIEYIFHVTLLFAMAGLAWYFVQVVRNTRTA